MKPVVPASLSCLMERDDRITGFSDEGLEGFFIYTDSSKWCDDAGAGTFRGNGVREAIRHYKCRVMPAIQLQEIKE